MQSREEIMKNQWRRSYVMVSGYKEHDLQIPTSTVALS
jgi:hypothetical protein